MTQLYDAIPIHRMISLHDEAPQAPIQYISVYMHKKALHIELQNVAVLSVILRTLSDEAIYSAYTKMRSFPFPASIAVIDELLFKIRIELTNDEMVHHPISEVSSEYFSLYRLIYNESDGSIRAIASRVQIVPQINKILLIIHLKSYRISSGSFVFTAIKIGLK